MNQRQPKLLARTASICALSAMCLWFTAMYLYQRYYETLPRTPVTTTGNLYPYNYHGVGIYLTHA